MIIVQIIGGLGNQMFQYAFARSLSKRSNAELKLDLTGFEEYALRRYELNAFNISATPATEEEAGALKRKRVFNNTCIKEKSLRYNPKYARPVDNKYFQGYWQSEEYFKDAKEIIRKDFTFTKPLSPNAKEYADKIQSSNAVSLHIRRGDYIVNNLYETDLAQYYKEAISKIKKEVKSPEFFIFSDDKEYSAQVFEEFNIVKGLESIEDMHLMSLCKHNIIANSSFSWWGAWLNPNPEKIVIAPKKWFTTKKLDSSTLIPDVWLRL